MLVLRLRESGRVCLKQQAASMRVYSLRNPLEVVLQRSAVETASLKRLMTKQEASAVVNEAKLCLVHAAPAAAVAL